MRLVDRVSMTKAFSRASEALWFYCEAEGVAKASFRRIDAAIVRADLSKLEAVELFILKEALETPEPLDDAATALAVYVAELCRIAQSAADGQPA